VGTERRTIRAAEAAGAAMVFAHARFVHLRSKPRGAIDRVGALEQGKGLEFVPTQRKDEGIIPVAIGRGKVRSAAHDLEDHTQLVTVFTATTDFAETEVDTRQNQSHAFSLFSRRSARSFSKGRTSMSSARDQWSGFSAVIPFLQPANWITWRRADSHQRGCKAEWPSGKLELCTA